jgi:hypothetical protein
MSRLIVVMSDRDNLTFPAIQVAAMYGPKAKALGHDTVRIEKAGGVRVAEFTLDTISRFMGSYGLNWQLHRTLRRDRGDYEFRTPVYPGWRKETN